jgi:cytochrome c oxidase cbb3-type subunit 3
MSDDKEPSWPGVSKDRPAADSGQDKVIHEYDGIQEYDNRLPNWWLYTLFGSIVFAGLYWATYHVLHVSELPRAEYDQEVSAAKASADRDEEERLIETAGAPLATGGPSELVSAEALAALSHDPAKVGEGKQLFVTYCAPCHGADGGGKIGPNLTDNAWLHGGAPEKIFRQVMNGSPTKGMIPWGPQIGADRVKAVTAYVLTIKNTNVAGGKPPQGEIEN